MNQNINLDSHLNIYILHYTKLTERKVILKQQLEREHIKDTIWIENFDRENLTKEQIDSNYVYNKLLLSRGLTLGEIANGIGHNHILETIARCETNDLHLVLEDDMLLCCNFLENIKKLLNIVPSDWEAISLGGYRDETPNFVGITYSIDNSNVSFFKPNKICIQTGGFLIKKELCKRIIKHPLFRPFSTPIDETLCNILPSINAKVYWSQPLLAYEGSKIIFGTSFKERGF